MANYKVKKLHDISYWRIVLIGGVLLLLAMLILGAVGCLAPSNFGNYIAGIAGLLNVFAFIGLTIMIHVNEAEQADKSMQFRAEELIIMKIQSQQEKFNDLHMKFLETKSPEVAQKSFEMLQPLMTYLFYLGRINFLTESIKTKIEDTRQYFFVASNTLISYASGVEDKQLYEVFKTYREIYQRLGELEVMMLADVAKVPDYGIEITNYKERQERSK